MALDIIGPANAPNSTTARPTDDRSFGGTDTWFKDCTSSVANDGTKLKAGVLNSLIAQVRSLIRGNGLTGASADIVPQNNADDNMLLKSVQHLIQRNQPRYAALAGSATALTLALTPAAAEYKAGMVVIGRVQYDSTGPATLNVNGLGARNVVRFDGQPVGELDLTAGGVMAFVYDGTNFQMAWAQRQPGAKIILTSARVYYVNGTIGNDTYDGRSATISGTSGPVATIQRAADLASRVDANGYSIDINVADGTYAAFVVSSQISGALSITGNLTTPANCTVAQIAAYGEGVTFVVRGFRTNGGQFGIVSQAGSLISFEKIVFGAASGSHIYCDNGDISCIGDYTISGSAQTHASISHAAFILTPSGYNTVTIAGGLGFSTLYSVSDQGFIRANTRTTFAGSTPSAVRFSASALGLINTSGAGTSFFPGTSTGVVASGGIYT